MFTLAVGSFIGSSIVSGSEREDDGDDRGSSGGVDGERFFSSELWLLLESITVLTSEGGSGGIDLGGPRISVSGLDALSRLGKVLGLGITSLGGWLARSACLRVSPSSSDSWAFLWAVRR